MGSAYTGERTRIGHLLTHEFLKDRSIMIFLQQMRTPDSDSDSALRLPLRSRTPWSKNTQTTVSPAQITQG